MKSRQLRGHSRLILLRLAPTQWCLCLALEALQGCRRGTGVGERDETWPFYTPLLTSCKHTKRTKKLKCHVKTYRSHTLIQTQKKHIHNVSSMCISDASCVCRNVSISSRYDRWADSGRGHLCLQSVVWVNCCEIWQACLMIHSFS